MHKKILVVHTSYYKKISDGLCAGVINYFEHESKKDFESLEKEITKISFDWLEAPGSFEVPFLINKNKDKYDGFIALGCIVRGQTYHFEVISNEVTRKIMDLSIEISKPIGFGVLTCENMNQAEDRSSNNKNNKGSEAAKACLKLLLDGQ